MSHETPLHELDLCDLCSGPLDKRRQTVRTGDIERLIVCPACARCISALQERDATGRFFKIQGSYPTSPRLGQAGEDSHHGEDGKAWARGDVESGHGVKILVGIVIAALLGSCCLASAIRSCTSSSSPAASSSPATPSSRPMHPAASRPTRAPAPGAIEPAPIADPAAATRQEPVDEVSAPTPPPLRDGTVSARIYREILPGMTYARVVDLIGAEGKLKESGPAVGGGQREAYSWPGRGAAGASFVGIFERGVLVSKAEFNVK